MFGSWNGATLIGSAHILDWVPTYPADFVQEVAITSLKALPLKTWSQVMENRQQYTEPEIID
jgi:hypothetical protein